MQPPDELLAERVRRALQYLRFKWTRFRKLSAERYDVWAKTRRKALYDAGLLPFQKVVRDPNFPCPACGARNGEIRWVDTLKWPDGTMGALVHQCKICTAAWGQMPIVNAQDWKISLTLQEAQQFARRPLDVTAVEIAKNA